MSFMQKIRAMVWKDLTSELRTKELIISMCLFSFLVLIIFNFAFALGLTNLQGIIPGILWVAFIFSLCPVSPWGIYLAKMFGVFIFTIVMEIFTLAIFTILYNVNLVPFLFPLGLIIFLGTLGFATVGTIFSAMSASTRTRDVILSILVFPIIVPVLIASVKATGTIIGGKALQEIVSWLKILIAFDLVFLLLAYLTFGFIVEE
jgi:heme exporter protein B